MPVTKTIKDAQGNTLPVDPFEPVACVNIGPRQVFDLGDPSDSRKVSHYEIETGEEFTVPRCYSVARLVNDDGHEAIGSILTMVAPSCYAKDHPKAKVFLAQQAEARKAAKVKVDAEGEKK